MIVPAAPTNATNYNFAWEYNSPEVFYGAVRGEVDIADNLTAFASIGGSDRSQVNLRTNPLISTASARSRQAAPSSRPRGSSPAPSRWGALDFPHRPDYVIR